MKGKILLYAAVVAAVSVSCTREAEESGLLNSGIDLEFTATWADVKSTSDAEIDSRTVLQEDGTSIWWTANEEINAFFGSRFAGRFTSTNTTNSETATFQGTLNVLVGTIEEENDLSEYWAVYPYSASNTSDGHSVTLTVSSVQTASAGTFADKFFPAVANSKTLELAFYNVCGGARFSVTQEGVTKVIFKSNGGSPMAGTVKVGFGNDGKPQVLEISDAKDSVVVNAPEGGFVPGKNYFAAMLPHTHAQGLTITLHTASKEAAKDINKSITVRRSAFSTLDNVDEGLDWHGAGYAVPEIVDLGLSVKWASFNVGASAPEEYGDYFAWGETEPKEDYSSDTEKWRGTKYIWGRIDNKPILDPEDDAATVNWGDKWRMPTIKELGDLLYECSHEWTSINGVEGIKFTSRVEGYEGRWIFFPAAGERSGLDLRYEDECLYWSSSLETCQNSAWSMSFDQDYLSYSYGVRYVGKPIRPVYGDRVSGLVNVNGVRLDVSKVELNKGERKKITATIYPIYATEQGIEWSSSNPDVATISSSSALGYCYVKAIASGNAVITATTADGGFTATCEVHVNYSAAKPEAVDLGLSVKWATFNLGATKPEEYGDYFAWGETEPKEEYTWVNYKFRTSGDSYSNVKFSKYNTSSSYDPIDNKTVLDPEDDAAAVNLGGSWRMPTLAECKELVNNCTWTWTTQNGVNGRLVSGPNGNSIFLPAAGYRNGTSLYDAGSFGYYWSSSLFYTDNPYNAYYVYFYSGYVYWGRSYRYLGSPVRPVYADSSSPEYETPYNGGGEDW